MNKHIQKIINDPRPECQVKGHRVHVTINGTGENWPKWSHLAYGIGGGFIHFEKEEDYNDWKSHQPQSSSGDNDNNDESTNEWQGGRYVPECGPIGFRAA